MRGSSRKALLNTCLYDSFLVFLFFTRIRRTLLVGFLISSLVSETAWCLGSCRSQLPHCLAHFICSHHAYQRRSSDSSSLCVNFSKRQFLFEFAVSLSRTTMNFFTRILLHGRGLLLPITLLLKMRYPLWPRCRPAASPKKFQPCQRARLL